MTAVSTKQILIILAVIIVAFVVWTGANQAEDDVADGYCHTAWKNHVGPNHEYLDTPIMAVPGYGTPEFYQFMEACKVYYHETR